MFWGALEDCPFKAICINANVVRFLISEAEGTPCEDLARVSQITMAIGSDIHHRLCMMQAVPDMGTLFMEHYIDPAGVKLLAGAISACQTRAV